MEWAGLLAAGWVAVSVGARGRDLQSPDGAYYGKAPAVIGGQALTADRYQDYLLSTYLQPAATTALTGLSDQERSTYLSANPWIQWDGGRATFTFAGYLTHLGAGRRPNRLSTPST